MMVHTSITTHKQPYSASTMFVTHGIPSFFELPRKCVYNFSQRISLSSNSIITACLAPSVFIHSPVRQWWRSVLLAKSHKETT